MSVADLYLCWDQRHSKTEREWFNFCLLHCHVEAGIANAVLPFTSRKWCCETRKERAKVKIRGQENVPCGVRFTELNLLGLSERFQLSFGYRVYISSWGIEFIGTIPSNTYRHSKNPCPRVKLRTIYVLNSTHIFAVAMVRHQEKWRKLRRIIK